MCNSYISINAECHKSGWYIVGTIFEVNVIDSVFSQWERITDECTKIYLYHVGLFNVYQIFLGKINVMCWC